jgi:hypothetical protein
MRISFLFSSDYPNNIAIAIDLPVVATEAVVASVPLVVGSVNTTLPEYEACGEDWILV